MDFYYCQRGARICGLPPLLNLSSPLPPLPKSPLAEEDREGVQKAQETNPSLLSFLHFPKCSFLFIYFFIKMSGSWRGKPKGGTPLPDPHLAPSFILEISG